MRGALLAVLMCGCGRVGFATNDARRDADLGDAIDAADDAAAVGCNLMRAVHDEFDSALDMDMWGATFIDTGTSAQTAGGELILTSAASSPSTYVGVQTARHYDMGGDRVVVEVPQVATNAGVYGLQIRSGTSRLEISEVAGVIRAVVAAPTFTTLQQRAYVPATDRFWAISESAGTITWETSADGVSFTPLAQAPASFDVGVARVELFGGTESAAATTGEIHFSRIGTASATSPVCSSDILSDTFAGSALDVKWLNSFVQPCCTMNIVSGQLVVTTDGTPGYAFLRSAEGYDLRGHHVDVELVQPSVQAGTSQSLVVERDSANKLALVVTTTVLNAYEVVNGVSANHTIARMASDRYLRIGESGGMYTVEASADRQTWRLVRTAPVTFSYDNVTFALESGIPGTTTLSPETIIWDNFNTP